MSLSMHGRLFSQLDCGLRDEILSRAVIKRPCMEIYGTLSHHKGSLFHKRFHFGCLSMSGLSVNLRTFCNHRGITECDPITSTW